MRELTPLDNFMYELYKALGLEPFLTKCCYALLHLIQRIEKFLK